MEIPNTLCSNVYDFAFCPEPCYERLADLADPEDWGPGNRILKNYLSFSFSRAVFLTERDVDQTAPSNLPLVFDDGSVEKVGVRALAAPVSDIRNQLIS